MPAESLFHTSIPDKRVALVRGVLVVREPPGLRHGRVALDLGAQLLAHVRAHDLGQVYAESGFIVARDPDTVRGPDVAFISRARLPQPEPPPRRLSGSRPRSRRRGRVASRASIATTAPNKFVTADARLRLPARIDSVDPATAGPQKQVLRSRAGARRRPGVARDRAPRPARLPFARRAQLPRRARAGTGGRVALLAMPAEPACVPNMSSAALMTADELLALSMLDKRTELVRGVLVVREPAGRLALRRHEARVGRRP